ncbi:hypothetical protein GKJ95_07370 [Escherichia coli]|nr:hypothetical protein [Escherichia coli]
MTRVVIALLFLAGCTSQMKYSNVVRIRNVCSSDINVFIPEYVFGGNVIKQHHIYLPVNGIDVLSYFYTENINDGFQYEEAFTVNKDSSGNFDYPFVILSSGREKKFGKNDLIELSRDISTKDDKKHGGVKYMIDSQNICP